MMVNIVLTLYIKKGAVKKRVFPKKDSHLWSCELRPIELTDSRILKLLIYSDLSFYLNSHTSASSH